MADTTTRIELSDEYTKKERVRIDLTYAFCTLFAGQSGRNSKDVRAAVEAFEPFITSP